MITAAIAVFLLGDAVLRAGWGEMLLLAPWVLLIVWAVYVAMYASAIETDAAGATVQNLLRRTRVPWTAVADIVLRYQVAFVLHDGREVRALGGPASGRPGRLSGRVEDDPRRVPMPLRQLDVIRAPWIAATADRAPGVSPDDGVVRSWDVRGILAFAILAVWAAVAVVITRTTV